MIWMSGPDKLCNYFNQPWLEFTGRAIEAELGNGWVDRVHPEDLNRCMLTHTESFDQREPFRMEYRLKRKDGNYRWVLDIGVPRYGPNGSFAGYIGSCIEVTERKLAEEALCSVSGRLIQAQEQERTRIARELHDDINQRIAMLAIDLSNLSSGLPADVESRLEKVQQRILDIGKEVQAISHRLHSSKLEYLGLVPACRGFCRELAERHSVTIDFNAEGVPRELPPDISLTLFRVMQESLQNAIKHSGSKEFNVQLRGLSTEIHLAVRDRGTGSMLTQLCTVMALASSV